MAIIITHPLLPVHFTRNAIDIEFACPDKIITQGRGYRYQISFTNYPDVDGDTLLFTWDNGGVNYARTFTFKTTPDVDELEIQRYTGGSAPAWINGHLIPGLLADPQLAQDFMVGLHDGDPTFGVLMYALFEHETETAPVATGFTIATVILFSGLVGEYQPFYRMSAWLHVARSSEGNFVNALRTGEMELDADAGNNVQLNLERYADEILQETETPTDTTNVPVLCTVINRPAFLLYGQKWGTVLQRQRNYRTPVFRLLKGGMLPREFAAQKSNLPDYWDGRFLTMRPERRVNTTQKDWLYWLSPLLNTALYTFHIHTKAYRVDGTVQLGNAAFTNTVLNRTYQIAAGYAQRGVGALAGDSKVYKYEVSIRRVNTIDPAIDFITNTVTFWVDEDYLDQVFQYENTYGAIESFKFRGQRTKTAGISKEGYRTSLPFDHKASDTDLHTYGELVAQQITCHTGPLSATDALAMADFVRTRHRWLILPNGTRIPARILGGEVVQESLNLEANYARGMDFTVELGVSKGV